MHSEAVLFGGPHGDQLPPPRQQCPKFFGLCVGQRARRRADGLGKMGYGPRIKRIGLDQLPGGFGKVPHLTGINPRDGQGGRHQAATTAR